MRISKRQVHTNARLRSPTRIQRICATHERVRDAIEKIESTPLTRPRSLETPLGLTAPSTMDSRTEKSQLLNGSPNIGSLSRRLTSLMRTGNNCARRMR